MQFWGQSGNWRKLAAQNKLDSSRILKYIPLDARGATGERKSQEAIPTHLNYPKLEHKAVKTKNMHFEGNKDVRQSNGIPNQYKESSKKWEDGNAEYKQLPSPSFLNRLKKAKLDKEF